MSARVPVSVDFHPSSNTFVFLSYVQTGNTIAIDVPAGLGAFALQIEVIVSDGNGAHAQAAQEALLETLTVRLPAQAIIDQVACIRSIIDQSRQIPEWRPPEDHPDWIRRIETWRGREVAQIGHEVVALVAFERASAEQPDSLIQRAAETLGVSTADIQSLARSVRSQIGRER